MALIPDNPKQRNALLVAVALLAGLYVFYSYWYSPRQEANVAEQAHLDTLQEWVREARLLATRGRAELEERMLLYERHVARLEQLIPEREELPALIDQVASTARQIGVEMTSFNPGTEEPGAYYTRKTYNLAAVGDYHSMGEFVTRIASLSRIITPINLDITSRPDLTNIVDAEAPVLASFQIQTFVVPRRAEQTQAQQAAGAGGGT